MATDQPQGLKTLVSTGALATHPEWRVFDCRHDLFKPDWGGEEYRKAHVPGALFASVDHDLSAAKTGRNGRHPLPDPAAFAARLGAAGITAETQVVAYDAQDGTNAARLWWMMRWLGHHAVAVLDGGWPKWTREQRVTTAAVPHPHPAAFVTGPEATGSGWVDTAYVLAHLHRPDMLIVDARSAARFRGEAEPIDPVAGRIPGAVCRFFKQNLDADGCFKPAPELRADFQAILAGQEPRHAVNSCGSGVSACHNLLAMEIAGLTGSRLYPGSWSEWCADPARPIATG
jgi:thiosulfate/3-mercaptopyruvate sulfurtransferase